MKKVLNKIILSILFVLNFYGQSINARKANFILPVTILEDEETGQKEVYVLIIRNPFRNRGWEFPGGYQDRTDSSRSYAASREFMEETAGMFGASLKPSAVNDYFQGDRQNNLLFDEAIKKKLLSQLRNIFQTAIFQSATFDIGRNRMFPLILSFIEAEKIKTEANRIRNEGQRFACKIESTDFRWISLESLSKAVNKIKKKIIHGTVNILLKPLGSNETEIFNFTAYALRMLFQGKNFEKFQTFKKNILKRSRRRGPRRQKRRRI